MSAGNVNTGKRGRPRKAENDPALAPLVAKAQAADDEVLACVEAHAREPSQAATIALLNAQLRVAALRAHLARAAGDGNAARHESDLVIRMAGARDDAVGRAWGDELRSLHALVMKGAGVHVAIADELAAEEAEEDST